MAEETVNPNEDAGHTAGNPGGVQARIQQAVDDLKNVASAKAEDLRAIASAKADEFRAAASATAGELRSAAGAKADEIRSAATAKADAWREMANAKAEEFRGRAEDAWGDARLKARSYQEDGEAYVRENPARAVLLGVAAGFVLATLIRK